jgi:hypothetical protein
MAVQILGTPVFSDTAGGTAGTVQAVLTGVQAGEDIIVGVLAYTERTFTVTDDKSNTYAPLVERHTVLSAALFIAKNVVGGTVTITADVVEADDYLGIFATRASGIASASYTDGTNTNGSNAANATAGSITPSAAGVVVGVLNIDSAIAIGPGSGWTQIAENENYPSVSGSFIYQLTTSGAYNATWSNENRAWTAVAVALKAATGGGGRVTKNRRCPSCGMIGMHLGIYDCG